MDPFDVVIGLLAGAGLQTWRMGRLSRRDAAERRVHAIIEPRLRADSRLFRANPDLTLITARLLASTAVGKGGLKRPWTDTSIRAQIPAFLESGVLTRILADCSNEEHQRRAHWSLPDPVFDAMPNDRAATLTESLAESIDLDYAELDESLIRSSGLTYSPTYRELIALRYFTARFVTRRYSQYIECITRASRPKFLTMLAVTLQNRLDRSAHLKRIGPPLDYVLGPAADDYRSALRVRPATQSGRQSVELTLALALTRRLRQTLPPPYPIYMAACSAVADLRAKCRDLLRPPRAAAIAEGTA